MPPRKKSPQGKDESPSRRSATPASPYIVQQALDLLYLQFMSEQFITEQFPTESGGSVGKEPNKSGESIETGQQLLEIKKKEATKGQGLTKQQTKKQKSRKADKR